MCKVIEAGVQESTPYYFLSWAMKLVTTVSSWLTRYETRSISGFLPSGEAL